MIKHVALFVIAILLCACDEPFRVDLSSCGTSHPGPDCPKKETCPGRCELRSPSESDWSLPVLLWSGPALEAPACPTEVAGVVMYEGHADPSDHAECPTCSCEPPTGVCELPSYLTGSTETCLEGAGGTHFDFSPPDPWDGACNSDTQIHEGQGLQSIIFGPPRLTESGCTPITSLPPKSGNAPWKTFARACGGHGLASCLHPEEVCVPTAEAEPPPGFSQCVSRRGEHECLSGYPNKRVFYDDLSDSRHCSDCSCGPPKEGICYAYVTVYEDAGCSKLDSGILMASVFGASCAATTWDYLAGKTAEPPYYEAGWCEPIGNEPIGSVELLGPTTFCCH
jgi:hypothetical protein